MDAIIAYIIKNEKALLIFSKMTLVLGFVFGFTVTSFSQSADCPNPSSPCTPTFTERSALPDTGYYNCTELNKLDPKLNAPASFSYTWILKDSSKIVSHASLLYTSHAGTYILCYNSGGVAGCPQSDTVVIAEFTKKFAPHLPTFSICHGASDTIGIPPLPLPYKYTWTVFENSYFYTSNNIDKTVSNPVFTAFNNDVVPYIIVDSVIVTNTESGCSDWVYDSVIMLPRPAFYVDNSRQYCQGVLDSIDIYVLYLGALSDSLLTVDGRPQSLPIPKNAPHKFPNTAFPDEIESSKKYTIPFIPTYNASMGGTPISLTITPHTGCVNTTPPNIVANVTVSDNSIKVMGLPSVGGLCADAGQLKLSAGPPAVKGKFISLPNSEAVTSDATGYYFVPSKAATGKNYIYYTEKKTGAGCGATGEDSVIVNDKLTPTIIGRTSVCLNTLAGYKDTTQLPAGVSRYWQITPSSFPFTTHNANKDSISVLCQTGPSGIISLVYFNSGCSTPGSLSVNIQNNLRAAAPSGPDVPCLSTAPVTYSAEADSKYYHKWIVKGGNISYAAQNYGNVPNTNDKVEVTWLPGQAVYQISVRDSVDAVCNGTSDLRTIVFSKDATATILTPDTSVCKSSPFTLRADPAGGDIFTWNPGGLKGSSVNVTSPVAAPQYVLTVRRNSSNCPLRTATVKISVNPVPPNPLSVSDFKICFDEYPDTVINATIGLNSIEWYVDDILTPSTGTSYTATKAAVYKAVVSAANGCKTTGTVVITDDCPAKIFIPKAFSPNSDGSNDSLQVFGVHFENFNMHVFNRWGEVIFTSSDRHHLWGGDYNGSQAPPGVYPWVITYEEGADKKKVTLKGSVSLVR